MQDEVKIEEVIDILTKIGVRVTPQRIVITKIILDNVKNHPSFKEIHSIVQKQLPRVGISTIFNTMKMLEKAGVIRIFEWNGETHIDRPEYHVNVYCKDTGQLIDLEDSKTYASKLVQELSEKGLRIHGVNIIVEAECKSN